MLSIYSPDQSKVNHRAGKFLKSKCEISFSIRYLIFERYWAGKILKASKVAFKNSKTRIRYLIFVNKILKAMSFQIFAISERSKVWKQIAGKMLKANRWETFWKLFESKSLENFESLLKAQELAKFWKQIAGKFLKANHWKMFESKSLENFWKLFESKSLENFWKQNAGKNMKAFWTLGHIVLSMAVVRLGRIPLHFREKIVILINKGKSQREVYRRRTEKHCYFADPLPVYPLITVEQTHVALRCCRRTARWGRTVGEEVLHSLEDERSRLIIGVGL